MNKNWDALKDRDVVDVEFILGEQPAMKVTEELEHEDERD